MIEWNIVKSYLNRNAYNNIPNKDLQKYQNKYDEEDESEEDEYDRSPEKNVYNQGSLPMNKYDICKSKGNTTLKFNHLT